MIDMQNKASNELNLNLTGFQFNEKLRLVVI